jgi:hypothetical protein
MKPPVLVSAAAAAFGFALGWALKPAPAAPAPAVSEAPAASRPPVVAAVPDAQADLPPASQPPGGEGMVIPPDPGIFGQAMESLAKAREQRELAKMQRLAEALQLDDDQQAALRDLLDDAAERAFTAPADGRFLEGPGHLAALETAGGAILAALDELLSPAQRAELDAMVRREQENRVEAAAQRELVDVLDRVDLTAEQRDAALERSREAAAQSAAVLPVELELMLDSSVLPLGRYGMTRQAAEIFRAAPPAAAGQGAAASSHFGQRSLELAARLERMRDILTPAQFAAYRAAIEEQRVFLQQLRHSGGPGAPWER